MGYTSGQKTTGRNDALADQLNSLAGSLTEANNEADRLSRAAFTDPLAKCAEATDASTPLSREEFVDDLALTSMARLWDVGKSEPIKVGKASPTEGTLPGSVYFICKYDGDLAAAARANAAVGGDNAARAVAIGSVMGAALGVEAIPPELGRGALVEWDHANQLLDQMPLIKGGAAARADL